MRLTSVPLSARAREAGGRCWWAVARPSTRYVLSFNDTANAR